MTRKFDTSSTSVEVADPASDTVQRLAEDWRGAGIGDGDTVLVHSSLKRTMRRLLKQKLRVDPADVVESFRQATGPTGTVLFPLFSWDFPKPPSPIERISIAKPGHPPLSITLKAGQITVTSGNNTYLLSVRELIDLAEALSELCAQVRESNK